MLQAVYAWGKQNVQVTCNVWTARENKKKLWPEKSAQTHGVTDQKIYLSRLEAEQP